MEKIISYIKANQEKYLEELKDFLRIPSVSSLLEHKKDMKKAADYVAKKLKKASMNAVEIITTEGHPLVYGEWLGAPGKPTLLIYGHYDVQPAEPLELWETPAFEPTIKDGKIWGRGTTDDKGQLYTHVKAVEAFFENNGCLPINVKFILEGEEEVGSESLMRYVSENKEKLKCDAVLISDTSMLGPGIPTLTYGLRGLTYMQIDVTGPARDLHSGTYGGAVDNPVNVLADIISKLKDENGIVQIPGFYSDVVELSQQEKDNFKKLKVSEKTILTDSGAPKLKPELGYTFYESMTSRPTLDCNGIWGGFAGEGAKTIIPSKAGAKISMRLVPNQEPDKVAKKFIKYIKSLAPKTVKIDVTYIHGGNAAGTDIDHKAVKAATIALEKAFGKKTLFMKEGGSIPVVADMMKALKAPAVLMGFGLDSENLHSPNEHFSLDSFEKGIISSAYYINELAK